MLNQVSIIGRLTADPELRRTHGGTSVVNFTLAVDRDRRENGEIATDFFNMTAWSQNAEFLAQNCKKGNRVAVAGRLQTSHWTDASGNDRREVLINVDHLYPVSRSFAQILELNEAASAEAADAE